MGGEERPLAGFLACIPGRFSGGSYNSGLDERNASDWSPREEIPPGRATGCAKTEHLVHQPSSTKYVHRSRQLSNRNPVCHPCFLPRNRPAKTSGVARKALEIIQRNERGRQGKQRALLLKELREEEKKRRIYDATDQLEMDPEIAAANIQVTVIDALGRASPVVYPYGFGQLSIQSIRSKG